MRSDRWADDDREHGVCHDCGDEVLVSPLEPIDAIILCASCERRIAETNAEILTRLALRGRDADEDTEHPF